MHLAQRRVRDWGVHPGGALDEFLGPVAIYIDRFGEKDECSVGGSILGDRLAAGHLVPPVVGVVGGVNAVEGPGGLRAVSIAELTVRLRGVPGVDVLVRVDRIRAMRVLAEVAQLGPVGAGVEQWALAEATLKAAYRAVRVRMGAMVSSTLKMLE